MSGIDDQRPDSENAAGRAVSNVEPNQQSANLATAGDELPPPALPTADSRPPALRQHPSWIVISAIRSLRSFVLPLIVVLIGGGSRGDGWVLIVGGGIAILGIADKALEWWRFTYELRGGELRVRSGLFSRRERFVPLERIQAVDIAESPLQRLFRVVGVRVETAAGGGGAADVVLEAITRADAYDLRRRLVVGRSRVATPAAGDDGTAPQLAARSADLGGELIRSLSTRDVLIAGATSGRIGPALAVLSFGFQAFDDLVPASFWERLSMSNTEWSLRGVISLLLVVGLGAWLLAIGSTVLTFGGFELRRDGDRLLIRHGLLDRRRSTIPLARVQAVTMTEGVLRQPFGLAAMRIESAGYGQGAAESGTLFPLLPRREVPALLAAACPPFAAPLDRLTLTGPPRRALRRYLLGDVWSFLVLAGVATGVVRVTGRVEWWWGLAPLVAAPFALIHGALRYRDAGWTIDPAERLIVRDRQLARTTKLTQRRRLQRRTVRQHLLQRRARLATFEATVAVGGGGTRLAVEHLDADVAGELQLRLRPVIRTARPATTLAGAAVER